LLEKALKTRAELRLLVLSLGKRQRERVAQQHRIAQSDLVDDRESVERLGRRYLQIRAPQRRNEPGQRNVHGGIIGDAPPRGQKAEQRTTPSVAMPTNRVAAAGIAR
jgi:ribosome biogenesis SPOUT family RNA methylase Rps3